MTLYSKNERKEISKTIFKAYFPFKKQIDYGKACFAVMPINNFLSRVLLSRNYYLVVHVEGKKFKKKISTVESELLVKLILGYDLYNIHDLHLEI